MKSSDWVDKKTLARNAFGMDYLSVAINPKKLPGVLSHITFGLVYMFDVLFCCFQASHSSGVVFGSLQKKRMAAAAGLCELHLRPLPWRGGRVS